MSQNPSAGTKQQPDARWKIAAIFFKESIAFGGEVTSLAVGSTCDSVEVITDPAEGVLLRRIYHDRVKNRPAIEAGFVHWSNVRFVKFSE